MAPGCRGVARRPSICVTVPQPMLQLPFGQETQDFETTPQGAGWERLQLVVVQDTSSQVVPLRSGT